jgi:hypothetical protein
MKKARMARIVLKMNEIRSQLYKRERTKTAVRMARILAMQRRRSDLAIFIGDIPCEHSNSSKIIVFS